MMIKKEKNRQTKDEKGDALQTIDKEINKGKLIEMVSQPDRVIKKICEINVNVSILE